MEWLWIILRYLFPGDPIRQGAEAIRQRVSQLVQAVHDQDTLALLLVDPALRLQLEFLILDAEDSLRLWISMRGCQIARIRPKMPWAPNAPRLTHPKDLPELLARISALLADCDAMEQRAQAHAAKLKQMRDADPLAAHGSPNGLNDAARCAAAHHEALEFAKARIGLILRDRAAIVSKDEAVLDPRATSRAPPHSNEGSTP